MGKLYDEKNFSDSPYGLWRYQAIRWELAGQITAARDEWRKFYGARDVLRITLVIGANRAPYCATLKA